MNDNQRSILRTNRRFIVKSLENVKPVIDYLMETHPIVLTKQMRDEIMCEKTPADKVRKLLDTLTYRGPNAFDEFYASLLDSNNPHIADKLCPEKAAERNQSNPSKRPEFSSFPKVTQPESVIRDLPNFPSLIENYNPIMIDTSFNTTDGPSEEMKKKFEDFRNVYELKNQPKGYYLIITNKEIKDKKWAKRDTDSDVTALQGLFDKLGYRQLKSPLKHKSSTDLRQALMTVTRDLKPTTQSLIVFIHSYGTNDGFFCYDGELFKFDELIDIFTKTDQQNFALVEKPKLFFVQSCSPEENDPELDALASGIAESNLKTDSGSSRQRKSKSADFYLYLSRTPGSLWTDTYSSNGCWFVQAFVDILAHYSHQKNLDELMLLVNQYVDCLKDKENKRKMSSEEVKVDIFCQHKSLDKEFYFYPSVSEPMTS